MNGKEGDEMKEQNGFKIFCQDNGYTAREVAEKLGVSLYAVRAYMQGTRFPNRRVLKRFEDVYGIDYRDVFDW